jgi:hypothetical protein
MTQPVLRLLIKEKLDAGRLPYESPPALARAARAMVRPANACEETVTVEQHVIGTLTLREPESSLHVACFHLLERRATTSTQPQAAWGRACRQRRLDAGTTVKIRRPYFGEEIT